MQKSMRLFMHANGFVLSLERPGVGAKLARLDLVWYWLFLISYCEIPTPRLSTGTSKRLACVAQGLSQPTIRID